MKGRTALAIARGLFAFTMLTANGLVCLFLYAISFGTLRRFNHEWVSVLFCRATLAGLGIRLTVRGNAPDRTVMYIFNHNSYLDIFLMPSLRLPRTRTIISERTKRIIPLYLCNLGVGSLFIPFKDQSARRIAFFKKLTAFLRRGSESVVCAPEGVHTFRREIGKFNRGIFHAAMAAGIDLQPIFVAIPPESDPLESYHYEPGRVTATFLAPISTRGWTVENLDRHIAEVRAIFVDQFARANPDREAMRA